MILLHELGMKSIEDYFNYIIESRANGQHKQCRELFWPLSTGMKGERGEFFCYLNELGLDIEDWNQYLKTNIQP